MHLAGDSAGMNLDTRLHTGFPLRHPGTCFGIRLLQKCLGEALGGVGAPLDGSWRAWAHRVLLEQSEALRSTHGGIWSQAEVLLNGITIRTLLTIS